MAIFKSSLLAVSSAAKMICGHLSIQAVVSAEAFFVQKRLLGFCCVFCKQWAYLPFGPLLYDGLSVKQSNLQRPREPAFQHRRPGYALLSIITASHSLLTFVTPSKVGCVCVAEEESGGILQKQRIGSPMTVVLPMMQHCLCRRHIRNIFAILLL